MVERPSTGEPRNQIEDMVDAVGRNLAAANDVDPEIVESLVRNLRDKLRQAEETALVHVAGIVIDESALSPALKERLKRKLAFS